MLQRLFAGQKHLLGTRILLLSPVCGCATGEHVLEGFFKGLMLGLVAGIPLGPASAAVVDVAIRKGLTRAVAVGLGGATVDLLYCLGAVYGVNTIFEQFPFLSRFFLIGGGCVLVVFGLVTARAKPIDLSGTSTIRSIEARTFFRYFAKGVVISVANPALLVSWALLAGTTLGALAIAAGVVGSLGAFIGVCTWFFGLAYAASQGRMRMGSRAIWIPRIAGFALIAYGLFLVVKTGLKW